MKRSGATLTAKSRAEIKRQGYFPGQQLREALVDRQLLKLPSVSFSREAAGRWALGAKATAETVAQTARLLPMPGEQHVFLAQLAGVADERELQAVLVRADEGVNAGAVAAFWIYATGSLDGGGVARDGDCAPRVAFAVAVEIDIERAIGPADPDGAERVGPGAGEGGLSRARISGTGVDQHQNDAGEKELKGALCFHAAES